MEGDLVDRQVLDGRAAPLCEPRRSESREEHHDPGHQRERNQAEQPEPRAARFRRSRLGVHQSSTSKKPIQPSSANSVLWAWNMYLPGYGKLQLEDPALSLHLADRVRVLGGHERRPCREVVEEVGMQVKGVDRVVLEDVDEVDTDERVALHLDRAVEVVEAHRVDGVDLVAEVEVRVERVHDHHELVGLRAGLLGVDDEHAVEALRDVRGERRGVAVVEVEPERPGIELVGERLAGLDEPAADLLAEARHAVHLRGVDAVEVNRVRVSAAVAEAHPQPVPVDAPERGPGDAPVERPGGVLDARSDLDLLVARDQLPLAQRAPVGQLRRAAPVEVAQDQRRVEAVGGAVDDAAACKAGMAGMRRARRRIVVHAGHLAGGGGRSRSTELRGPGRHRAERRGQRREHLPSRECNHRALPPPVAEL